jgi:hypothetical protein
MHKKVNIFARFRGLSAKQSKAGCWRMLPSTHQFAKNAPFDTPIGCSGSGSLNDSFGSQKLKNGSAQKSEYLCTIPRPEREAVEGRLLEDAPFDTPVREECSLRHASLLRERCFE